jgi:hypothetical protein
MNLPDLEAPAPRPPPTESAPAEKLYQLLYAGEVGAEARPAGQRARMLAWLQVMALSPEQLEGLLALVGTLRDAEREEEAARASLGAREGALFGPIYAELNARLATGTPLTEAEAAGFAARLESARAEVAYPVDPRRAQVTRVQGLLDRVRPWVGTLNRAQRGHLADSRFFLARRLGPLANPGAYAGITGIDWDGGNVAIADGTVRADDERQMDLGGLWTTEHLRAPPEGYIDELQLLAIVTMALQEPGLPEAVEILLGRRGGDEGLGADATVAAGAEEVPPTEPQGQRDGEKKGKSGRKSAGR